jgi:NhaP-type Na+/H+ or K+/H+ antiporter
VRDALRLKHYSYRTEQAYVGWICPSGSYASSTASAIPTKWARLKSKPF